LAPWYANALHDNQDLVMLYDSDGNPEFKQDHLTYHTTGITGSYPWDIKGDLFKNLVSNCTVNVDLSCLHYYVICQNPAHARQPPSVNPEADFNQKLLHDALKKGSLSLLAGADTAMNQFNRINQGLSQVGVTLHNAESWRVSVSKVATCPYLSFGFQPISQTYSGRAAPSKRIIGAILSGIAQAAFSLQRNRAYKQRLDQVEEKAKNMAQGQSMLTQKMSQLDMNQDQLSFQLSAIHAHTREFEEFMVNWVNQLKKELNPLLQVHEMTIQSLIINQEAGRAIDNGIEKLEEYTRAATMGTISPNILPAKEIEKIADQMIDRTGLRAIYSVKLMESAIVKHPTKNQTVTMIVSVPIVEPTPYFLIEMVPIATFQGNLVVEPKVQHKYVAVAQDTRHFYPLSDVEFHECLLGPCSINAAASTTLSDECGLAFIFGHDIEPCEGVIKPGPPKDFYLPFGDLGTIYGIVNSATVHISCPGAFRTSRTIIKLNGTGTLHLPPLCSANAVGTPPYNTILMRGPEATYLFKVTGSDGLIHQMWDDHVPISTETLYDQSRNVLDSATRWKEALLGKTHEIVQSISSGARMTKKSTKMLLIISLCAIVGSILLLIGLGIGFLVLYRKIIRRKFKMDTLFTSHLSNVGSRLEQFTLDQTEQREDDHRDQMWRLYNANLPVIPFSNSQPADPVLQPTRKTRHDSNDASPPSPSSRKTVRPPIASRM
jgi:hypothetical protein